jgi:phosphonopyruvate decarboxylase
MIDPKIFFESLNKMGITFYTGVPDSLLKNICSYITDNVDENNHIIAANEGNAIALAAGYHLATGKLPVVYMQNSGLGNAINPLLSLCDPDVYSIPLLILIGWRGEPGVPDEPQHIKQGKVQIELLKAIDIPYEIVSKDEYNIDKKIAKCAQRSIKENRPFAILVKKGTFNIYNKPTAIDDEELTKREKFLEIILKQIPNNSVIVSTTGKTSREIFDIREKNGSPHFKDFLTVGSMGHCSSIALGIAVAKPDRKVICIDGDGSLIMHMGSLSTIGKLLPKNFYHILINNYAYESVGGQATSANCIEITKIAKANGYKYVLSIEDSNALIMQIENYLNNVGPAFLEIKTKLGSRENLGRPTIQPIDNKLAFMDYLSNN